MTRTIAACLSCSVLAVGPATAQTSTAREPGASIPRFEQTTEAPPVPAPSPAASPPADDWDHLRLSIHTFNFSHDPSGYSGPRSAYVSASWTVDDATLMQARFYLDNYLPREVAGTRTDPELTFANFEKAVKEVFLRHRFANGMELTVGDIRSTAHSDNNKTLYAGDGKPVHSDIVELDRVLGVSVARDWGGGKVEFTISDRGRKDLRFDGWMEALRVSKVSKDSLRQVQVSFVNRSGDDAGGRAADRQWQTGVGGSLTTRSRMNTFSGEYVRGNFFPGRRNSKDAFSVAYERRLVKSGALSAVADYEQISGETGVRFYEGGLGANLKKLGDEAYLRLEGGYRYMVPTAAGTPSQSGGFVRVGIAFDHGRGAARSPDTLF